MRKLIGNTLGLPLKIYTRLKVNTQDTNFYSIKANTNLKLLF